VKSPVNLLLAFNLLILTIAMLSHLLFANLTPFCYSWCRSRMPSTLPGQLTIEKTPSYFVTRSAPQRVFRSMSRDVRLIVVVRDPVTRALSDYTQGLVKRPDLLPFERMAFGAPSTASGINTSSLSMMTSVNVSWGAIRIGLYARHLERWLRWFPLDRFHFVSGEHLVEDPAGEIGRLEDFLGVQRVVTTDHFYFNVTKGFPCLKKSEARAAPRCLGQAKGRAHPVVDPVAIERLRRFFQPFNRKFYEMTSIDFGWQWCCIVFSFSYVHTRRLHSSNES